MSFGRGRWGGASDVEEQRAIATLATKGCAASCGWWSSPGLRRMAVGIDATQGGAHL